MPLLKNINDRLIKLLTVLLLVALSDSRGAAAADCRIRIAIAPPRVEDTHYGRWLVKQTIPTLRELVASDCEPLIDYESTINNFDFIGISYFFGRNLRLMQQKQREYLITETQANRLLSIEVTTKGVVATLYLLTAQSPLKKLFSFSVPISKESKKAQKSAWLLRYLALLTPNAFSLGFNSTQVSIEADKEKYEEDTRLIGVLPPLLSSMTFNKIEHPLAYQVMDYSFSLFPGAYFFGINQITDFRLIDPSMASEQLPELLTARVNAYGACNNINGQVSLFWILGTSYSSLGLGPCIYRLQTDSNPPGYFGAFAWRFVLGHRVFMSQNIFTFFEADILNFDRELYRTDLIHSRTISRGTLGVGWYVPDVESVFLDVFE